MSLAWTKQISEPSGERLGSVKLGSGVTAPPAGAAATAAGATDRRIARSGTTCRKSRAVMGIGSVKELQEGRNSDRLRVLPEYLQGKLPTTSRPASISLHCL